MRAARWAAIWLPGSTPTSLAFLVDPAPVNFRAPAVACAIDATGADASEFLWLLCRLNVSASIAMNPRRIEVNDDVRHLQELLR